MKRNLALLLTMAAAAFAQTPTVEKPTAKASSQTVKVAPVIAGKSAKPSPTTVKVATTAAPKPAVVSVKPAATHTIAAATVKSVAVPVAKPVVVATPAKVVAVTAQKLNVAAPSKQGDKTAKAAPVVIKTKGSRVSPSPTVAMKVPVKSRGKQSASTQPKATVAGQDNKSGADKKQPVKTINAIGRRDPFVSPVVNLGAIGSGCSSGKRCLAIDQIALKGVVRSEAGMIAVVVNAMDKAYFLRENDPVFNGYVTKITGDSIVFKETFKDRLGKSLTRDITKTIRRPVA
jgi:hypothetical protein